MNVMELTSQIGGSVTDGLAYLGELASISARAAYFTFVGPFRGKPLRLGRAISQAMQVGVRALPILSLITFFIGLILALQAAYELRRLGAVTLVANAVAIGMTRELGPLITAIVVIVRKGFPADTLQELAAYVRAHQDQVTEAHGGVGSIARTTCALLQSIMGTNTASVAYRGTGESMKDMVAGQVDFGCDQIINVVPQVQAGTI